jgi:hypothetical protein
MSITTPGIRLEPLCCDFKDPRDLYWTLMVFASNIEEGDGWPREVAVYFQTYSNDP